MRISRRPPGGVRAAKKFVGRYAHYGQTDTAFDVAGGLVDGLLTTDGVGEHARKHEAEDMMWMADAGEDDSPFCG